MRGLCKTCALGDQQWRKLDNIQLAHADLPFIAREQLSLPVFLESRQSTRMAAA
jgi:hypothetical protein